MSSLVIQVIFLYIILVLSFFSREQSLIIVIYLEVDTLDDHCLALVISKIRNA